MGVTAQIRYNMREQAGYLEIDAQSEGEAFQVTFAAPVRAATPGQALVCYEQDRLIGGGVIDGAH